MSFKRSDASSVAAPPPCDHSGFLHKRGHMYTAFKRRFFVLTGAKLSYYEDIASASRRRRI